jgi:mediator of RNA polymerase II transcription subunit 6
MVGIEYMLLHVQEPVLYVIRKQHRHSATDVTPMSDYYIIDGTVYQAPDLGSVVNSRIVRNIYNFQINS